MIDFKKFHQRNYVLVCVCVGGRGTHSLANNNLRREWVWSHSNNQVVATTETCDKSDLCCSQIASDALS